MPRTNLVDNKKKVIISVNYKCASSQIIRWFRSNLGDYTHENTTMSNTINRAFVFSDKHLSKYNDYYKVLIIRNPYSRLVSSFLDKGFHNFVPLKNMCAKHGYSIPELSFKQFIDMISKTDVKDMNAHWRPLFYDNQPEVYNKVVKMEHIFKHMNSFAKAYGYKKFPSMKNDSSTEVKDLSAVPIKDLKNTPKKFTKKYSNYYNADLIKIVNKIYQSDLKLFKYSYDRFLVTN